MDDYDTLLENGRAENDEITLFEMEEDRIIRIINSFKAIMQHEPEFTAINNISSFDIHFYAKKFEVSTTEYLNAVQIEFFKDLYDEIFPNVSHNTKNYNSLAKYIFSVIYV